MTSISSINTNAPAMQYQSQLTRSIDKQNTSMERLSSGLKINTAKDDAAGLQISNRLQVQNRGMDVAIRNANDGISMLQTAEGALGEYTENLMQMRDLALRYVNGSLSSEDQNAISVEFETLKNELSRIRDTTSFGDKTLFRGEGKGQSFQIGASSGEAVLVDFPNLHSSIKDSSPVSANYIAIREDWQSKSGDEIGFLIYGDKGTKGEYKKLSIHPKAGSDMKDIANELSSKFGEEIGVYYDAGEFDSPSGTLKGGRLYYYAISGAKINRLFDSITPHQKLVNNPFVTKNGGFGGYGEITPNSSAPYSVPSLEGGADVNVTIDELDKLIGYIDSERAKLGAIQNRFSHAINNLSQSSENVADSHSQIRDTDFAKESTQLTKQSILKEVNTSMLAQAGNAPRSALNLLS